MYDKWVLHYINGACSSNEKNSFTTLTILGMQLTLRMTLVSELTFTLSFSRHCVVSQHILLPHFIVHVVYECWIFVLQQSNINTGLTEANQILYSHLLHAYIHNRYCFSINNAPDCENQGCLLAVQTIPKSYCLHAVTTKQYCLGYNNSHCHTPISV